MGTTFTGYVEPQTAEAIDLRMVELRGQLESVAALRVQTEHDARVAGSIRPDGSGGLQGSAEVIATLSGLRVREQQLRESIEALRVRRALL